MAKSTRKRTVGFDPVHVTLLKHAQERLLRLGLDRLDGLGGYCSKCSRPLKGVRLTSGQWTCDKCGYAQDGLGLGVDFALTEGAVSAAGLVALLDWLSKTEPELSGSTSKTQEDSAA